MTKTIKTLVKDVEAVLTEPHEFSKDAVSRFSKRLAETIVEKINPTYEGGVVRISNLGKPDRQLWYSVNHPDAAETLPFSARMKFLFGDILEELLMFLAEEAGHTVEGRQDVLSIGGVSGHRDGKIDGVLVDAKSASSFSYKKFKDGLKHEDDAFGYLTQLNSYHQASQDVDPSQMAFFVIDKQLGHVCLDIHKPSKDNYAKLAQYKTAMVQEAIPPRCYEDEEDGKSGNRKLGTACSYCPFKRKCWPEMRTFLYSNGPRYLTKVARLPDVQEV